MIVFVVVLGLQAAWILIPEIIRKPLPYFPASQTEINTLIEHRDAAVAAAKVAWVRGDLWVDYALTADAGFLISIDKITRSPNETEAESRQIAEHAAAHAPYDARVWLLLSAINAKSGWKNDKALAQLKMSFYTSPNDIRLIPLRMRIATRLESIADDELQNLIEHEIRTAVRKPGLRSIIATAYREASPAGRQFIEAKLAVLDPNLASELRAGRP